MTNAPQTSELPRISADAAAEARAATTRRDRLVIGLLLVSTFIVILNETIMSVAIPRIMDDLGILPTEGQWLTTSFLLTMAVVIPITGFLLQRFNTKPIYIAAMTLFSAGTLIAALSPGFTMLIVGRVVQASGTAIMLPLLMTTVMTLVPANNRGRVMGNISVAISVAPALGPTISGIILHYFDWRWIFWLVLPIAVAALIVGGVRMRNVTTPIDTPIDVFSVIVSAFAFGGLVYGLSNIGDSSGNGTATYAWIALGVGAVMLVVFIFRQLALQKRDRALLDLRTFSSPTFSVAMGMMAITMMAMFGSLIVLPLYMQRVLELDPLQTGLLLLPGGLIMGLCSPFVGRAFDRVGPMPLLVPGAILVSGALWFMSTMGIGTPFYIVLASHVVLSIGLALIFTPLFTSALGSLPPHLYSHGSAVLGTVQQLAGAAGTALFITVLTVHSTALLASGATQIEATAGGIQAAFVYGGIISAVGIGLAFFIRKPANVVEGAMH